MYAVANPEICKGGFYCVLSRGNFKNLLIFIDYIIIGDVTADTYVNTKNVITNLR